MVSAKIWLKKEDVKRFIYYEKGLDQDRNIGKRVNYRPFNDWGIRFEPFNEMYVTGDLLNVGVLGSLRECFTLGAKKQFKPLILSSGMKVPGQYFLRINQTNAYPNGLILSPSIPEIAEAYRNHKQNAEEVKLVGSEDSSFIEEVFRTYSDEGLVKKIRGIRYLDESGINFIPSREDFPKSHSGNFSWAVSDEKDLHLLVYEIQK